MIVAHFNIDYLKTNDLNLINANDGATYLEKSLDLKHPLTIGTIIIEKILSDNSLIISKNLSSQMDSI